MSTTKPAGPEDNFPTAQPAPCRVSPLARAALANGVAFDDVTAYVDSLRRVRVIELGSWL